MTYYIMKNEIKSEDDLVADGLPDFIENDDDDIFDFGAGKVIWKKPVPLETFLIDDNEDAEPCDAILAPGIEAPLVNEKIIKILDELEIENIQLFPIKLMHEKANELIDDYYILNVIGKYDPVDHERSKIRRSPKYEDMILGIDSLTFKDLKDVKLPMIFRLEPFMSFFVVHENIKNAFEKAHVTGFSFYTPENTKL